jgi:MOSC domain-containing protein YiiM
MEHGNAGNEGVLEAIWIKRAKRAPMDRADSARLLAGSGIEGNADQGGWRQVTVISREAWDGMMASLDARVDPSARRANLLVRGVDLREARGRILHIGACRLEVRGETRPCERMDEACAGLRAVMRADWNGGVFGVILNDGEIRVGDPVRLA